MTAQTRGVLVAIEGIDGAGKTTQIGRLRDWLTARGLEVVCTKEPTNGPHGARLRASAASGRLSLDEELALFEADRREHVAQLVEPALARGAVVLIDRYYPSTAAYQGARGADASAIVAHHETFAPRPDLIAILDVAPDVGLARVRARGDVPNAFEQAEALARARGIFAQLAGAHVRILDASRTADEVEHELRAAIEPLVASLVS